MTSFDPAGRARRAFENNEYRLALRAAQEHLSRSPDDQRAALMAARCLTRMGSPKQAERYYQRLSSLSLDDSHDRAYGLVLSGNPEKAAEVYFDIITRWPEDVLALKRLAAVLIELKQWKPALLLSERLIRIPRGEVAGHTLAGIGFHLAKHAEAAVASFERVLLLDAELKEMPLPQSTFWNHLALELIAMGRPTDARAYLERALAKSENSDLRELLGVTFEKEGNLDRAEQCWRQVVNDDPTNADALLGLGRLALGRRRWDEAEGLLDRAATLSPRSIDPIYNLSRVYRFKGEIAKAEHYEAKAAELRRSQPRRGGMGEAPDGGDLFTRATTFQQEPVR